MQADGKQHPGWRRMGQAPLMFMLLLATIAAAAGGYTVREVSAGELRCLDYICDPDDDKCESVDCDGCWGGAGGDRCAVEFQD